MNGRMLSRAIHRTSPATIGRDDQDGHAWRQRGEPRVRPGRPSGRRTAAVAGPPPSAPSVGRQDRQRRKARARPWCRRLPDVERPSGPATRPADGQPAGTAEPRRAGAGRGARRQLPASAGGSSSPATRPHPSSPGASWATRGTRRSTRPGCRSIGPPGATGPRSRSGRPSPRGMALEGELADLVLTAMLPTWRRPRGARSARAARLASRRPVRRLARRAGAGRPGRGGRLPDRGRRGRRRGRGGCHPVASLTARSLPRERQKGGTSVVATTFVRCWPSWPSPIRVRRSSSGPGRGSTPSSAPVARRRWSRRSARRPARPWPLVRSSASGSSCAMTRPEAPVR